MNGKRVTCIQCDNDFVISEVELDFLQSRGFDEPRRCPLCRKKKSRSSDHPNPGRRSDKKKHYRLKYEEEMERSLGNQRINRVKNKSNYDPDDSEIS